MPLFAATSHPKRKSSLLLAAFCLFTLLGWAPNAFAANTTGKGLLISPLYQYVKIDAGSPKAGSFTIADLNNTPMTVTLSVKQFSVADYTYDYQFSNPANDWLKLGLTQVTLQPGQSQQISYSLLAPAGTAPGGYYYTVFASANLANGGISATVQAATLLYVTVSGQLITTGQLDSSSVERVSFGKQITYRLTTTNTGNVYYFAYFSGNIHGLFTHADTAPVTHLLFPGKARQITGAIPAPVLPGIYKATYGYRTDSGASVMQTRYVLFIPPWFIVLVLIVVLVGSKLYRRKPPATKPA